VGPALLPALEQHKAAIEAILADAAADQDLKEMLRDEYKLVQRAITAPSQPFVRNFEKETEVEEVKKPGPAKTVHGLSLKQ
jgi:hypothetical protein